MTPLRSPAVIFLNGPIGVGKTTLGRALATRLGGAFIDSDDLRDYSKSWIAEVLTGSKKLVKSSKDALEAKPIVIVAKALRVRDYAYFRAAFEAENIAFYCVTLTASEENILAENRRRSFDAGEQVRIAEMIAQGYADRPFSDATIATDALGFEETLEELHATCRELLATTIIFGGMEQP